MQKTDEITENLPVYPTGIVRLCAVVDELPELKDVPDVLYRLLCRLIKKTDLRNLNKPITVRRASLAQECQKSLPALAKGLAKMEELGIIERDQKPRFALRGSDSPITWTPRIIQAFHRVLNATNAKPKLVVDNSKQPPIENDTSLSVVQKDQSKKKQSGPEPFGKENLSTDQRQQTKTNPKEYVVIQGRNVLKKLAPLAFSGGLTPWEIFRLMGLATAKGKRLEDIVMVKGKSLDRYRGRQLSGTLVKIINDNKDYGFLAKQQHKEIADKVSAEQNKSLVERKSMEWAGRVFQNKDRVTFEMLEGGQYVSWCPQEKVRRVGFLDIGFVKAVMDGRLMQHCAAA